MAITLPAELENAVTNEAQKKGTTAEKVVLDALREKFAPRKLPFEPRDEWERGLLNMAVDCGVSLTDEQVSSEGLYE